MLHGIRPHRRLVSAPGPTSVSDFASSCSNVSSDMLAKWLASPCKLDAAQRLHGRHSRPPYERLCSHDGLATVQRARSALSAHCGRSYDAEELLMSSSACCC